MKILLDENIPAKIKFDFGFDSFVNKIKEIVTADSYPKFNEIAV